MGPKSATAAALDPPMSFYKIMLPSIINDHKLRIPEDFAKVYEKELSSYATLIIPNGKSFCVRVEKAAKMLWIHNGWKEFAKHHSIRCGFFLVFDYEGNSKFKVHIYDLTGTEIEYPKNIIGACEEPEKLSISSEDKIFNKCLLRREKRKTCLHSVLSYVFEFAPELATRIDKYGKCVSKSFLDSLRYNCQHKTRNKQYKMEGIGETNMLEDVTLRKATSKAYRIKSENDELIPENHETLVENSRFSNESETRESSESEIIPKNHENQLENSEFLNQSEIQECSESEIIPENHENLAENFRCFKESELQESSESENIPEHHENLVKKSRFLNQSEIRACSESETIPDNHENLVEYFRSDEGELQNHMHGADKNEQRSAEELENMTRVSKDKDRISAKRKEREEVMGVKDSSIFVGRSRIQDKQKAVNNALMLKLKNPYFMIILKNYNVDRSSILHVPAYFGKKYLSSDTRFLELEAPDGKRCKVSCFANSKMQYLGHGWFEFVNYNNLLEGDVCIFELIQVDDVVLKVHIFRTCQTSLY